MSQRIHVVSKAAQHWAIEKEGCPTCQTGKGYACLDVRNKALPLPTNTVHVSRVRANGFNVRP